MAVALEEDLAGARQLRVEEALAGAAARAWVETEFGRPTPSTRRRPHNCICSMACRFHAIDAITELTVWELYRRHMGVVVQLDKNGNVKGVS